MEMLANESFEFLVSGLSQATVAGQVSCSFRLSAPVLVAAGAPKDQPLGKGPGKKQ